MVNKLCFLKKLCGKCPKSCDTPLIIFKNVSQQFGQKTHNTIRVSNKRKSKLNFLFSFYILK